MGTLLREFRKYVRINDAKIESCLELAVEKRNFLMHHYFREREDKLSVEKERMALLTELVQIGSLLEQAAALVGGMRVAFSNAMLKTENKVHKDEKSLFSIEVTLSDEKT